MIGATRVAPTGGEGWLERFNAQPPTGHFSGPAREKSRSDDSCRHRRARHRGGHVVRRAEARGSAGGRSTWPGRGGRGCAVAGHAVAVRRPPGSTAWPPSWTPFTGDFDAMVKRRAIRVGVTFNRTHYFIDKGQERGLDLRVAEAVRGRSEHGPEDRQPQGARGDRADVARSAVPRPRERQGRHGRRHGDRHARAREARRLLGADAHQRERSGGHRTRRAADRDGGRSRRPGGVRPQGEHLRREPRHAERAAEGARQAAGRDRRGPRRARRR